MLAKTVLCALLGLSAMAEASVIGSSPYDSMIGRRAARALEARKGKATTSTTGATATTNANTGNNNAASNSCLAANAVQTGSANDGSFNATAGQSLSKTDTANFINFCEGKTLTNGLQVKAGSCNGVTMGQIPASTNMISAVIVFPQNGQTISANQDFNLQVQVSNLVAGSFTNAASTYYSAPQALDSSTGNVIGHTHLVVQNTGSSLNPTTPMDPTTFAFFKGIDDAGNGKGLLSAAVAGGLPVGNYRLCSMTSASNHQPVLMPVAQRGAQDDCVRFTVAAGKNTNTGSTTTAAAAAAATTTKAAAATTQVSSASAIGGIAAPAVTNSGDATRPFEVEGNTFVNEAAAVQRACSIQNNACADAVNSGKVSGFTVGDCNTQEDTCNSAGGA